MKPLHKLLLLLLGSAVLMIGCDNVAPQAANPPPADDEPAPPVDSFDGTPTEDLIVYQESGRNGASIQARYSNGTQGVSFYLAAGDGFLGHPSFSPDGITVAYTCKTTTVNICSSNIAGDNDRVLIEQPGSSAIQMPSWRNDSQKVALVRTNPARGSNIQSYELATRAFASVTNGDVLVSEPDYASTTRDIVFVVERGGGKADLYIAQTDGKLVQLTNTPAVSERGPEYSPTDSQIAFSKPTGSDESTREIFVMDVATKAVTQVTSNSVSDSGPSWSPDGSKLAIAREKEGLDGIITIDATSGQELAEIDVDDDGEKTNPVWGSAGPRLITQDVNIDEDGGSARIPVLIVPPATQTVTVDWAFDANYELAPEDTTGPKSGTLTFAPGESRKEVVVPIVDDALDEDTESDFLRLTNASGGIPILEESATLSVYDNDAAPTASISSVTIDEGASGSATVTLSAPSGREVIVWVNSAEATAIASEDYDSFSTKLEFPAGTISLPASVNSEDDDSPEPDEQYGINLAGNIHAGIGTGSATVTIEDDDSGTPSAEQIVFERENDLFLIQPDGTGEIRLTNTPDLEWDPDFSPDKSKIVFSFTPAGGAVGSSDLYTMPPTANGAKTLLFAHAGDDYGPAYSPDGSKIVFYGDEHGDPDIFIHTVGGATAHITTSGDPEVNPDWSPDGARIVFQRITGSVSQIIKMAAPLGAKTETSFVPGHNPTWSPDCRYIAYNHDATAGNHDVFIINQTGGTPINLVNGATNEYAPAWSPNSNALVFVREAGASTDLFTITGIGTPQGPGAPVALTTAAGMELNPAWQQPASGTCASARRTDSEGRTSVQIEQGGLPPGPLWVGLLMLAIFGLKLRRRMLLDDQLRLEVTQDVVD